MIENNLKIKTIMLVNIKKIKTKYDMLPIAARAGFWFTCCSVIPQVIIVFTTPIFTRVLSTSDYGISSNYSAWQNIFCIFFTMSLYAGVYNNAMAKYKDDRDGFTSAMMGLSLLLGAIGIAITVIFSGLFSNYMSLPIPLIIYMGIYCMFYNPYGCWISRTRFEYKYTELIKITLLVSVLSPLLSLLLIFIIKDKAVGKIIGQYIIYIILGAILYVKTIKKVGILYVKEYWIFALKFNIPLIPHYLSLVALNQADRIMIINYCGASDNGIYSVAYSAASLMLLFNSGITQAMTPWTYGHLENGDRKSIKNICSILCVIYVFIDFSFILLAPEIIYILAGEKYIRAIYAIPPIATSMFLILLYNLFSMVEFYFEKTKAVMVCSILSALLNIILNYIFIPQYGFVAAAYTTLLSYLFNALIHAVITSRICKKFGNEQAISWVTCLTLLVLLLIMMVTAIFLFEFTYIRWGIFVGCVVLMLINRKKLIGIYKILKMK